MINEGAPDYSSPQIENNGYVVLRVAADADISISSGDETLTNIDGKQNAETDFGSMYVLGENGDVVIFALSADKVYDIQMDSFKSDAMDYDIRFFDSQNNLVEERSFDNLPVTEETSITTDTSQTAVTIESVNQITLLYLLVILCYYINVIWLSIMKIIIFFLISI